MKKGFTIIEVIVVVSIFSIVSLVSINTFLTTFRVSQQTNIENGILNDARFIMSQITRSVESNTLDYEEYFSHCVMSQDCPNTLYGFDTSSEAKWTAERNQNFGQNYGYYSWQFFYGGTTPDEQNDDFGTVCQVDLENHEEYPNPACVTGPLTDSEDSDTGTNPNEPRIGSLWAPEQGTAFCTQDFYQSFSKEAGAIKLYPSERPCLTADYNGDNIGTYMMDELYLIDESGSKKTILALETVSDSNDKALSRIELDKASQASVSDISMPLFGFTCSEGYNCSVDDPTEFPAVGFIDSNKEFPSDPELNFPLRYDPYVYNSSEDIFADFVPISPLRVNVKSLKFLIGPLEDPRRSFGEDLEETKIQPVVTVFLELEPSSEFKSPFLSKNFNLKLQTTVTSGIIKEVPIVSDSE